MASSLGDQLRKIAELNSIKLETVVRKTVLDMSAQMIRMSPVDTGRFRGNWQFGIGSVNESTSGALDPSGSSSVNRITSGAMAWKPGESMYISNSLPYAKRLEDGWSSQSPSGMVKVTMASFQAHFEKALAETSQ